MKAFSSNKVKTLQDYIDLYFKQYKNKTFFKTKIRFRTQKYAYKQIYEYIKLADELFKDLKIKPKDKIILLSPNSPQLATLMLAAYYHNVTIIPLDIRSSKNLIKKIYKQTKPKHIFTSRLRSKDVTKISSKYFILEDLFSHLENHITQKNTKKTLVKPEDIAEIMYTSGTTGDPKGVILTHKNIVSNICSIIHIVPEMKRFESISILPLSHVFEQSIGLLTPIYRGGTINYPRKTNSVIIKKTLNEEPITHLVVVPQVLKNLLHSIESKAEEQGKKETFKKLLHISKHLPKPIRKAIFNKVHKELGGNIKFIVSAGAKLDPNIAEAWVNMGFNLIEGYGATEVTAAATGTTIDDFQLGSVGYPLPNVKVKIDKNNEVLIKGPNVSQGYYKNPKKTKEVFLKNGWYHTGDMGKIKDGRLFLLGRDAFKIVLSSGENVYVEDLESKINSEPEIWDSCAIALEKNGRERLHLVIIPAQKTTKKQIKSAINRINKRLEYHQQINTHSIWPESDFPRTHTLKKARQLIKSQVEKSQNNKNTNPSVDKSSTDKLVNIIANTTNINTHKIKDSTNLGSDLSLDSIDRIELIAQIEDEFDTYVDDYIITGQTTIKDLRKILSTSETNIEQKGINLNFYHFPYTYLRLLIQRLIVFPLHSLLVKTEVQGLKNLHDQKPPFIVVFNHIGQLDYMTLLRYYTNKQLLKQSSAISHDFWIKKPSWYSKMLEFLGAGFPVSSGESAGIRSSLENVGYMADTNHIIAFAPEGGISRSGKLQKFKPGIGVIATEMKLPIIPIKLVGDYQKVFPVPDGNLDDVSWTQMLPRLKTTNMTVKIGKPLLIKSTSYQKATRIIEDTMKKL